VDGHVVALALPPDAEALEGADFAMLIELSVLVA
jgi:hypothetical protein